MTRPRRLFSPPFKQLKLLTNTATPLDLSTRIDAIDVLRGIALFGVLAVNLVTEFRVSIFQQLLPDLAAGAIIDVIELGFDAGNISCNTYFPEGRL